MNPFPLMRLELEEYHRQGIEGQLLATVRMRRLVERVEMLRDDSLKRVHFDGPCPFLMCLENEPHDHPVCQDCGAVCWGNQSCATCRRHWLFGVGRSERVEWQ
jgi:hypothetical protein